ncbi:MAG: PQQ-binding-like beta-propeller repeat protein, partial [Candidatus Sumerlaeia bacterium]|nr:PQQ-binding-like beta-propeller repeat protein [Candidatus Sumerlaeia bacterium]
GAGFFVARAWCRYLCPFGLVCGWAAHHAAFQIERKPGCTNCGICNGVCDMEAVHCGRIDVSSCIACMKCVDHCPEKSLELVARPFGQEQGAGRVPPKKPSSSPLARISLLLGFCLLHGMETHAATVQWNGFRGDAEARAFREFSLPSNVEIPTSWTFRGSDVTWNYAPGASVWSSPAVAQVGDRVVCFVGSYDHNVYAIDAATGKELWRYPTGSGVFSTPAVARLGDRDCVLAASSDRTLYCLDAARGVKLWAYEIYEWRQSLGRAFLGSPLVWEDHGQTLIGVVAWIYDTAPRQVTEKAEILALTPENGTGRLLWRRQFAESHPTHPVLGTVNGHVRIYVGCRDGNLYCLDSRGGGELWRKTSKFPIDAAPAFLGAGVEGQTTTGSTRSIVFVGSKFGDVRAFDAETGDRLWSCKVGHWVDATPAVVRTPDGGACVVFGAYDGRVYCREARTGRARWHYTTRGNVSASAAIVPCPNGFEVYVPSDDDMLHAIDGRTGRGLWQISPGPFLWTYRGLGDTIWESPAAARLGDVDLLIQPFYDGRVHAYRLDRAGGWMGRSGDPAYGRAMVGRIAASMIGTLVLALVFVRMGKNA